MNTIYFMKLKVISHSNNFQQYLHLVSEDKKNKISKMYFENDKKLSLYSELLIRQIACRKYKLSNNELFFKKNEYGKPFLLNHHDFHFNVSHTNNAMVVSTHSSPIGIDIEEIHNIDPMIAIRFFCPDEIDYIFKTPYSIDSRLLEIWTKKESYLKFLGKGLSLPLNSFSVFDCNISSNITTLQQNNFLISVCTPSNLKKTIVIEITEDELINSLSILF